ncbi:hypothetical protein DLREEDagrD3_01560 [Denitratisoma sp. agr-D3]
MTLNELLATHAHRAEGGVPDWMLGFWKRYAISFANGQTDVHTHVCWLQSRNFTIDLRLPVAADQVPARPLADYRASELRVLADYEGWTAPSTWDGRALQWHAAEASLQWHNRWPEPALLQRVGNCMVEFAPSGAYVEDWRLQPSAPGPLIGLRLVEERQVGGDRVRHRGGALIVCGDHAALVLGRAEAPPELPTATPTSTLKIQALAAQGQEERLASLFGFETSVAKGSLATGFTVTLSTRPGRIGQSLFADEGFAWQPGTGGGAARVTQRFQDEAGEWERLFVVDTLERELDFSQATPWPAEAAAWFEREAVTLGRYLQPLY